MRQEAKDIAIMLGINIEHHATNVMLDAFYGLAHEQGRQQGIKQERALWELAKIRQEIENDQR